MTTTESLAALYVLAREALTALADEIAPGASHGVNLYYNKRGPADELRDCLGHEKERILLCLGEDDERAIASVENAEGLEAALTALREEYAEKAGSRARSLAARMKKMKAELAALESAAKRNAAAK